MDLLVGKVRLQPLGCNCSLLSFFRETAQPERSEREQQAGRREEADGRIAAVLHIEQTDRQDSEAVPAIGQGPAIRAKTAEPSV